MSEDFCSNKKAKINAWKDAQRVQARAEFPLYDEQLLHFFERLDELWPKSGCAHDLRNSVAVAQEMGLGKAEIDSLFDWCNNHGGFCDCEVAANTRDYWENHRERK